MLESGIQQLCFGGGERELNLNQVRDRVESLQRTLDELLVEMQQRGAHWTRFLDKMSLINLQYVQVLEQLRPVLRNYSTYPRHVDSAVIEHAIPELLTSKLLPDMEAQEAALLGHLVGGEAQLAAAPEAVLEAAEGMAHDLRVAIGFLLAPQPGEEASGVLADKGPGRRACDAVAAEVSRVLRQQQQMRAAAGAQASTAAGTAPRGGQKRARLMAPDQLAAQAVQDMATSAVRDGAVAAAEEAEQDLLLRNLYGGQLFTTLASVGQQQWQQMQQQQSTAAAVAAAGQAARAEQERALADAAGVVPMQQG